MSLFNKRKMFAYVAKKNAEKKPIWLSYLKSDGNSFISNIIEKNQQLFSKQLYNEESLISNLRPCLNPRNLKPAMYDTITRKYYYNEGSGEFQYNLNFIELDYIKTQDNQIVDIEKSIYENSILIKDVIPCRMNDGRIGTWDFITGTFSSNIGNNKLKGYINEYQVGESLKGDGNAYLNLNVSPTENTSIEILWSSNILLTNGNLYGSFSPYASPKLQNRFQMVFGRDKKIYIGYGAKNTVLETINYCNGKINTFQLDAIKKQFIGNGIILNNTLDPADLKQHKNLPLYLFNTNQGGATAPIMANIYSCILKEIDKTFSIFIPVKKNDGTIGMLDIITHKLFTNDGTGEFLFIE